MNITSATPFAARDAQPLIVDSDICNFEAAVLPSKLTVEIPWPHAIRICPSQE